LVAFHAHPDDESLLMGGTIAKLSAAGHRVVLVTATDGAAGLAADRFASPEELGRRRLSELEAAATVLGAARVVHLGYPDGSFEAAGVDGPAKALLEVLDEEQPAVLTGYDPAGGYGHPDHVHVHRVARRAAELASGPALFEATVDRERLLRAARIVHAFPGSPPIDLDRMRRAYLPRAEITHEVDVRAYLGQKLAGLECHLSQQSGGPGIRTVTLLKRLPGPLARFALGREWFREVGGDPTRPLEGDVFARHR
jgi:LmbE family N-acetylglucosaminyl deacetylase